MFPAARFLQRTSLFYNRAFLSSSSPSTPLNEKEPASSAAVANDDDYYVDISKFVDSIGMDDQSFAKILRNSKLMQLGDINGRIVVGNVVHRMQDDLYIDFGLKFNAVCKAPTVDSENYRVGSKVLIRLHDTELSEKFLGSKKDLTLLEADATLLRLLRGYKTPRKGEIADSIEKEAPRV